PFPYTTLFRSPLDVLRPDIAAIDDDQVLGTAGDDDFSVERVAQVAGVEPAVGGQNLAGGIGFAEVASHDAGTLDEDAADLAIGEHFAALVAHLQLMARQHPAAHHEAARLVVVPRIGRRQRPLLVGKCSSIDAVSAHARAVRAE